MHISISDYNTYIIKPFQHEIKSSSECVLIYFKCVLILMNKYIQYT